MNEKLTEWREKIDALSLRERMLVFFCAVAVLVVFWRMIVDGPIAAEQARMQAEITSLEQSLDAARQEAQVLAQAAASGINQQRSKELGVLRSRMEALDKELNALQIGLVSVDKLTSILEQVLRQTGRLQLVKMETLPVEMLALPQMAEQELTESGIYKHQVALSLRGSYFDVVNYLKKLEGLQWRFYWDSLDFKTDKYPAANIQLKVYTLTTSEGPINVRS